MCINKYVQGDCNNRILETMKTPGTGQINGKVATKKNRQL